MPDKSQDGEFDRELERWAAAASNNQVSPEAQTRIRHAVSASLVPVQPIPGLRSLTLMLFLLFALCAGALIAIGDKAGFRMMSGRQMFGVAAVLVTGGAIFSISLAGRMVPGSRPSFPRTVALALWGIGAIGGIALLFPWRSSTAFVSEGWPCAAMELIVAVCAAGLFWFVARRGAPFPDAGFGATILGLASALALLVLQFRCMFPNVTHLLVWHVLTAAAIIGAGAMTGAISTRSA